MARKKIKGEGVREREREREKERGRERRCKISVLFQLFYQYSILFHFTFQYLTGKSFINLVIRFDRADIKVYHRRDYRHLAIIEKLN